MFGRNQSKDITFNGNISVWIIDFINNHDIVYCNLQ